MSNRPLLIVLVACIAAAGMFVAARAYSQRSSDAGGSRLITASEAHAMSQSGEVVLIDIRTPEEWRETGIPIGAHAINMYDPPKVFSERLLKAVGGDRSRRIALICRTGNRSGSLLPHLVRDGFTNIVDVSEGMAGSRNGPGWLKRGLPTRPGAQASLPPSVPAQASAK